jgi:hypothetical protein
MLNAQNTDCLMCDRIGYNMNNYAFTAARLFVTDEDFRRGFETTRGVCLRHLSSLISMGAEVLSGDQLAQWAASLLACTDRELTQLVEELEQFSWQFDAASTKTTPESAADAVPRAIKKLAGYGPA